VSSVTTTINDSTLAIYPAVATFYPDGSWLFCDAFAVSDLRMCVVSAIPAIFRPVEQELTQLADLGRKRCIRGSTQVSDASRTIILPTQGA
jgi:hypothetical protein